MKHHIKRSVAFCLSMLLVLAMTLTGFGAGLSGGNSAGYARSGADGVRFSNTSASRSLFSWFFGEDEEADAYDSDTYSDRYQEDEIEIDEDGTYTSKEEVALYLHVYEHLPDNFITKKEARKLGWDSSAGNLDRVAPGMSIGGDYFGNYEGRLPEVKGRDYYECDIDYTGGYRGAKRIIYSDDGLIYYTEDHYETFELLYDAEGSV